MVIITTPFIIICRLFLSPGGSSLDTVIEAYDKYYSQLPRVRRYACIHNMQCISTCTCTVGVYSITSVIDTLKISESVL